jgi:hydroxyethylthiazole kinase
MNGLIDRSTAFVNALMVLDDLSSFPTASGGASKNPENYAKRQVP